MSFHPNMKPAMERLTELFGIKIELIKTPRGIKCYLSQTGIIKEEIARLASGLGARLRLDASVNDFGSKYEVSFSTNEPARNTNSVLSDIAGLNEADIASIRSAEGPAAGSTTQRS